MRKKLIFIILVLILFAIFLYFPFLGDREFQGEEGRRVITALQMLESKEYMIPHYFGKFYFNKPPLFNWVLAFFFYITKSCSEFTARAVSSLMACGGALFITYIWKRILELSKLKATILILLIPGFVFLTIPEVIDKAIRAEIDQTYTFIITLALFSWFYLYEVKNRKNLAFFISGVFLGLGILTKTFHALLFFYLTVIPYFFIKRNFKEFFSFSHLIGILTYLSIFLCWAIPVNLKIGFKPFLNSWLAEYKTATSTAEVSLFHHLKSYTIEFLIGYSPWIFFLKFYTNKKLKTEFLNKYPLLKDLALFSLCLFSFSYLFHLIFIGSRLRYMLPSAGGLTFLASILLLYFSYHSNEFWLYKFSKIFCYIMSILLFSGSLGFAIYLTLKNPLPKVSYFLIFSLVGLFLTSLFLLIFTKRNFTFNLIFFTIVSAVFFVKQVYVSFYYPYHKIYLSPYRKASMMLAEIIKKDKKPLILYKCVPHTVTYYLKYKFKVVKNIKYKKSFNTPPSGVWILLPEKYKNELATFKKFKIYFIKIRKKNYFLVRV